MDLGPSHVRQTALRRSARLLVLACAGLLGPAVQAQESPGNFSTQGWLNPGTFSYHFDRNKDLREGNIGIGAELTLAENHALMAGSFINSNRRRSRYGAYQWRPLHWQAAGIKVHAGIALGGFDGYPNYRNGAWFAAAIPMLAVEGERLGVNFFVVPTIANRLDGAVAVQVKLRVW